jgi:prepilin-type N-terminal cleavage/methylation domain-containing protein
MAEGRGEFAFAQPSALNPQPSSAFTLIEIMVVVGIIGLIMSMGVPTLFRMLHHEGFGKTISSVMELCTTARAQAILRGKTTEIVFYPHERRCELGGGVEASAKQTGAPRDLAKSVTFGDDIIVEMLDINLLEYKDASVGHVRFFPNGTSDELTFILRSGGEWRRIALEVSTGLPTLDSDPTHWR